MWQKISFIIPVLNEVERIENFLQQLQVYRQQGHELILVDGRSKDGTAERARPLVDRLITSEKGRARQQILGAKMATGQVLVFLHADTRLPEYADTIILNCLMEGGVWGRFNVRLSGNNWLFRIIERFMNWRSCLTGIATGDQAIFMTRLIYNDIGGMPQLALMEDIELSKRLNSIIRPTCIKHTVITSSRRWEQRGIIKTILFMWFMRLQYYFGTSPDELVKKYYP